MVDKDIITKCVPTETKEVVLTKKFKKAVYALAVRTTAQMVYMDDTYKYTLHEMITDIVNAIATSSSRITGVSEKLDRVLEGAPEEMDTLLEIWNYININGDSELAQRLADTYNKEYINELEAAINKKIDELPNGYIIEHGGSLDIVHDGNIFYQMEDDETDGIDDPVQPSDNTISG